MLQFVITGNGTATAQTFGNDGISGSRRTTARIYSAAWESADVTVRAQAPGGASSSAIAGLKNRTADLDTIPVDIPRGASFTVVTTSKSGSTPIYVEID